MLRLAWMLILVLMPATSMATLTILNATTHADDFIAPAVIAVLGSNPFQIDYDPTATFGNIVAHGADTGGSYFAVGTSSPAVNHAPYGVMNASQCCYAFTMDQANYIGLTTQHAVLSMPLAGTPQPAGTGPPTAMVVSSSSNSGNGGTGWGIEFGLSAGYLGLNTGFDSFVSAEMAGFLAALGNSHPVWNWFDVKAALRVTAANWSTGYDHTKFGYGAINWSAANSATTLYLQPPGMIVQNYGYFATITLQPYLQTRHANELVYSVSASYSWPIKNELTSADISASGATLLYTSNGTDALPMFSYVPVASGTVTLVAFTTDGSGNFSRVEEFSKQAITLDVGILCH